MQNSSLFPGSWYAEWPEGAEPLPPSSTPLLSIGIGEGYIQTISIKCQDSQEERSRADVNNPLSAKVLNYILNGLSISIITPRDWHNAFAEHTQIET